jgi:hypothetical protein
MALGARICTAVHWMRAGGRRQRRVRAGQAPEAAAHGYDDTRSFLEEFDPADAE